MTDIFAEFGVADNPEPAPVDVKTKGKTVDSVKLKEAAELSTALARVVPEAEKPGPHPKQGKTNPAPFTVQQLAKQYTEEAIATAVEIMRGKSVKLQADGTEIIELIEPSTRLEAAKLLLDRGWGKATVKGEIDVKHKIDIHSTLAELAKQVKAPPSLGEDHGAIDVEVQG